MGPAVGSLLVHEANLADWDAVGLGMAIFVAMLAMMNGKYKDETAAIGYIRKRMSEDQRK